MSQLAEELKEQGWAFVSGISVVASTRWAPDDRRTPLIFPVGELVEESLKFFAQEKEFKEKHSASFGFGYSAVDHKEGLRVLTGPRLDGMA